ncbi:3967_t:CDS:2, partial [Racocetra persica]
TKDPDVEMEEVYKDHEGQELQDPVTQNQDQNQDEFAELLEIKKVEPPKVNKKKEDVKVGQKKKSNCMQSWNLMMKERMEVEDDQRRQLLELLRENPDLCAQDISELGRTDIIRHCTPTQD